MTFTMSIPCSSSMGDGGRCFQTAAAASVLPKWPQACEVQEDGKNYSINLNHLLIADTSLFSKRKRDLSTSACKRASSTLPCIMLPHRDHRIQKWLQPYHSHQNLIPRIHFFCYVPSRLELSFPFPSTSSYFWIKRKANCRSSHQLCSEPQMPLARGGKTNGNTKHMNSSAFLHESFVDLPNPAVRIKKLGELFSSSVPSHSSSISPASSVSRSVAVWFLLTVKTVKHPIPQPPSSTISWSVAHLAEVIIQDVIRIDPRSSGSFTSGWVIFWRWRWLKKHPGENMINMEEF